MPLLSFGDADPPWRRIVDAVVADLTALSIAGLTVRDTRALPSDPRELPLAMVYAMVEEGDEESAGADRWGPEICHFGLAVELAVTTPADQALRHLDALAWPIRRRLAERDALWPMCREVRYLGLEEDQDTKGRTLLSRRRLVYQLTYEIGRTMPDEGVVAQAFLGAAPRIGPAHQPAYTELTNGD